MTPINLLRVVALAKLYKEKYISLPKTSPTHHNKFTSSSYYSTPYNLVTRNANKPLFVSKSLTPPLLPTPPGPPLQNPNIKRISPAEIQLRREKSLCYFCDEKFSFNHKCPNRHCLLLQMDEEENESEKQSHDDTTEQEIPIREDHHLSLNALKGSLGVRTIKFKAYIDNLSVTVLIDGGCLDNFLQRRVAKFLKLPVVQAPWFRVMVGNGNYMESEGLIQDLKLQAQGNVFTLSAFSLPILGADLILGASWLKTLGPHLADYDNLQIKFLQGGKFTTLQGDTNNLPESTQLHNIRRMVNTNAIAEVYNMQIVQEGSILNSLLELLDDMESELAVLLHNYSSVFSNPSGLPPLRSHDHHIPLLKNSPPVKVKPYRYPHSQKEEIEKLVKNMLREGIIQPSSNPFSSPIILVKKKHGSWRVCNDYRALNAITIKDSFPFRQ